MVLNVHEINIYNFIRHLGSLKTLNNYTEKKGKNTLRETVGLCSHVPSLDKFFLRCFILIDAI